MTKAPNDRKISIDKKEKQELKSDDSRMGKTWIYNYSYTLVEIPSTSKMMTKASTNKVIFGEITVDKREKDCRKNDDDEDDDDSVRSKDNRGDNDEILMGNSLKIHLFSYF